MIFLFLSLFSTVIFGQVPPPPPPPPPPPQVEEIFKVVEKMPSFPGCETIRDKAEKRKCSNEKMYAFIDEKMEYPELAKNNGIEGTVVIRFVVERDGTIANPEIIRDIGAGCGKEALRIVKTFPRWNPGKQRGRPVRVQFNLPVKFNIEKKKGQ